MKTAAVVILLIVCTISEVLAQASLSYKSGYVQNFDTLSSAGTAGTLVAWSDNTTIPGWYAYKTRNSSGPPANYYVDDGSSGTGGEGLRGYGSLSTGQTNPRTDRALGELSSTSDTLIYSFALRLKNLTGAAISSLMVTYRGEQWRQNTGTRGLLFEYQVGAASISSGTWQPLPALDFLPLKNGAAGPLDGNAPGNYVWKSAFLTTAIQSGQEIWLRWTKQGTASVGVAVDDLTVLFEPTAQPVNLSFVSISSTTVSASFHNALPASGGYLVLIKKDSAPAAFPADGTTYNPGDPLGDAIVVSTGQDTTFTARGLQPNTNYHFAVFAYNGTGQMANYLTANPLRGSALTKQALSSISSDVIPESNSEAVNISSLMNDDPPLTAATGVQVWKFSVRDGGGTPDTDSKPTIIKDINIIRGAGNSTSSWKSNIKAAEIFFGSERIFAALVGDSTLNFANANITVADDSSKTIALRISLKNTGILDNKILQFRINSTSVITQSDSFSSQMKDFTSAVSNPGKNKIDVTASKLIFTQQPANCVINEYIFPPVVIEAADANNNKDADYNSPVTVTASGAQLANSPLIKNAVSGTAVFDSVRFITPGINIILTAASGSFIAVSDTFIALNYRNFYIDAVNGNDLNNGLSQATAWKTLGKINTTVFQPGDSILFKSGQTWTGQLKPQGSGDSIKPIVFGKYGGDVKPVINGAGVVGEAVIYLYNCEFIEFTHLEVKNDAAAAGDRRGILVTASNFGLTEHIYFKNLYVHNIKGIIGDNDAAKRTAAFGFEVTGDAVTPTRFNDIWIDSCTIAYIENTGIYTDNRVVRNDYPNTPGWHNRKYTNIRITRNTIHHISKNAMIIRLSEGGLIEHNVCYETATGTTGNTMFTASCNGTVFQYNEGYYNRASLQGGDFGDGSMYDADLQSINCIFQYSYSHDNSHGLFWQCTVQQDSGNIVRYNVSKNDKGIIFCVNYPNTSLYIYNNTVYSYNLNPVFISERNLNSGTRKYHFYNNIIYNLSPNAQPYDLRSTGYTRILDNNIFYGFHPANEPADPHKITADPLFADPVSAFSTGLNSVYGFRLRGGSPAINSGAASLFHPDKDYMGNTVNRDSVDRGAFEYIPPSSSSDDLNADKKFGLYQNYPNPFNPSTRIAYTIPEAGNVKLEVFNPLGELVALLENGWKQPGTHFVDFKGVALTSGLYIYRLSSGNYTEFKKMLLIK